MVESGSEAKGNAEAHLSNHFKPAKIKSDDRNDINKTSQVIFAFS